jgi:hypothetical protein
MKFRVIRQPAPSGAHSPIRVIEQNTGREVAWINQYLDREHVRRLADKSLYSYAHSLLHFITLAISPNKTSPNRLCLITCATSPAWNGAPPRPPSTTVLQLPIAPSATSSPMLPARWRTGSTNPSCIADRWVWDALASSSAGCASRNHGSTSFRSRSMKWHASGPVFETPAT